MGFAPAVVLGLFAGVWADRLRRDARGSVPPPAPPLLRQLVVALGERPLLASRRQALIESARLVGGALLLSVGVASVTPDGGQSVAFAQAMPTGGVDPQMQEVLDALAALDPLPLETVIPRQARELPSVADAVQGALAARGQPPAVEPVGQIEHRLIPGGPGSEGTLVRIYTPASGAGPFPVLVYFHGGGWVIANLNVYDASARALANAATRQARRAMVMISGLVSVSGCPVQEPQRAPAQLRPIPAGTGEGRRETNEIPFPLASRPGSPPAPPHRRRRRTCDRPQRLSTRPPRPQADETQAA